MNSFYAQGRLRSGAVPVLHEEDPAPPERLLQTIWSHQRILRDDLSTLDGRRVRVLHPGFWNREAGPDFKRAIVQFDDDEPASGDVEIDRTVADWWAHRHENNPAFREVILHVVWAGEGRQILPTLCLQPVLDSPSADLALWLGSEAARACPEALLGRCASPLQRLSQAQLEDLLNQAALVRFRAKAAHLQSRAREAGWEQALWEGLFRALGYKQNVWPMHRLAELRSRFCPAQAAAGPLVLQARLLGVSGLLPGELTRKSPGADVYLRQVWDHWWRERASWSDCLLPRPLWHLHGLRPANHPQRRLALAAHWLAEGRLARQLERWCAASLRDGELVPSLQEVLQVGTDDFWSWHWTLRSRRLTRLQPLLGGTRVTDLAVNVVLPWLWMRAMGGRNEPLQQEMERRFFRWPAGQDNALLRLARERLLGAADGKMPGGAGAQQGLLQIMRDFCEQSDSLCSQCCFPDLVRGWQSGA